MRSLRLVDDNDNVVAYITKSALLDLETEYASLNKWNEAECDTEWLDWLMNIMRHNLA